MKFIVLLVFLLSLSNTFGSDTVIVSGEIFNHDKNKEFSTVEINVLRYASGNSDLEYSEIDKDGQFNIEFNIDHPQDIYFS